MTANEYQQLAMRTCNPALRGIDLLLNGVMGLCGEAGEVIDLVKKHLAQGERGFRPGITCVDVRAPLNGFLPAGAGREIDPRQEAALGNPDFLGSFAERVPARQDLGALEHGRLRGGLERSRRGVLRDNRQREDRATQQEKNGDGVFQYRILCQQNLR